MIVGSCCNTCRVGALHIHKQILILYTQEKNNMIVDKMCKILYTRKWYCTQEWQTHSTQEIYQNKRAIVKVDSVISISSKHHKSKTDKEWSLQNKADGNKNHVFVQCIKSKRYKHFLASYNLPILLNWRKKHVQVHVYMSFPQLCDLIN